MPQPMQQLGLKDGTALQGGCGLVAMPVPGTDLDDLLSLPHSYDAGYRTETNLDRNFIVGRPLVATIYDRSQCISLPYFPCYLKNSTRCDRCHHAIRLGTVPVLMLGLFG